MDDTVTIVEYSFFAKDGWTELAPNGRTGCCDADRSRRRADQVEVCGVCYREVRL